MDFVDEKKVHYSGDACANCGKSSSSLTSGEPGSRELKLCGICLEERQISQDALMAKVRRQFDLNRPPHLRSCFLRLLLSRGVDLEPSGWRTGMALGCELKEAGFAPNESKKILIKAGANSNSVSSLLNVLYAKKGCGPLNCKQIRVLDVVCDECPHQFLISPREHRTEIS
jgi:hypothetical protein